LTRNSIYTVDANNKLTAMRPSEPRSEDFMQRLVADHPELIADQDGALLLIRREQPIADREDGGGRWSLDHLFVTKAGVPVLVELKRADDTRLRREVVGQMLDYAANGTAYWQGGRISESFAAAMAKQGRDADAELVSFLGAGADPQQFWDQVDANFTAGRIKMVFVADAIPREVARIVEFLNEQMKADVRAVELSWFESDDGVTTLSPRIVGETERAQTAKAGRKAGPPIGRDAWIEENLAKYGAATVEAAATYISLVDRAGGYSAVTTSQGSIFGAFDLLNDTIYPMGLTKYGNGQVQFSLNYIANRPAFASEQVRRELYNRLVTIVGPLTTDKLSGFPAFSVLKLNDPACADKFLDFLKHIRDVASPA
jgi:hypothetical protein